jgi:hypothetical protein
MTEIPFTNSIGRGRNGWFKMAAASFFMDAGRVVVNMVSQRGSYPGPIYLELSRDDAAALGRELLRRAGQELQEPDVLTAVSPSQTRRQIRQDRRRHGNERSC